MKKNAVEMLSIINPKEESSGFGIGDMDLKTLALGAALGVAGLAAFLQVRKMSEARTVQPVTPALSGENQSGLSGLIIIGLLGAAGWYVWSKYISRKETEEALVLMNPKKAKGKKYKRAGSSRGGYFVRVSGSRESWPKPDSEYYPGGYPLKKAQDFARIGSQTGSPRKVLRGGPGGKVVRKYANGKRVWPTTEAQARSLRPAERPSRLRKSA